MNMNKLKGKIIEKGMSIGDLANEIGVDRSTLYRKIGNIEKFTIREASDIKVALGLDNDDACDIFF